MMDAITNTMTDDLGREITQAVLAAFAEEKKGNSTGGLEISADSLHAPLQPGDTCSSPNFETVI
jgi:hypothetical protein